MPRKLSKSADAKTSVQAEPLEKSTLRQLSVNNETFGVSISEEKIRVENLNVDEITFNKPIANDLEIDGDLTVHGGKITFGNGEIIHNESDDVINLATLALQVQNDDGVAALFLSSDTDEDTRINFMEGASVKWTIGNDADDSDKLKIDATNILVGGNTKLTLDTSGNATTSGTITSSNGVSQGKWQYDMQRVGYYSTSAGVSYLPMNGYIIEGTSSAGRNEYQAFIAPFDGYLHKILWRSEIAQSGNFRNLLWESSDGTEVPGTIAGRWDPAVSVADDTTVEFDFYLNTTSGSNALTKGNIYAISIDPVSAPYDTNATVIFKWDVTT